MKYIILFILISCTTPSIKKNDKYSVLQGVTSENSVEFSIMIPKGHNPQIKLLSIDTPEAIVASETITSEIEDSNFKMIQIFFNNLETKKFTLEISGPDFTDKRDVLLLDEERLDFRFIVTSCSNQNFSEKDKIWESVQNVAPDYIFMIGDNIYASISKVATKEEILHAYLRMRQELPLFYFQKLIPVHATWDDHDYGANDGNKDYEHKLVSQNYFRLFFAQKFNKNVLDAGPGISSRLHIKGMHFTFLDDRSFKDASKDGQLFGIEQEEWLLKELNEKNQPTWIISGMQFFGNYHPFESYEGSHPKAFQSFIEKLQKINTPFVFLSGDRHLSEIMQFPKSVVGQPTFEFTSSPIHAKLYPETKNQFKNPWQVAVYNEDYNFMIFQTKLEDSSWDINNWIMNSKEKIILNRELTLATESLADFTIDKKVRRRRYYRKRRR
jgi:alkaline phosphatase D